MFFVVMTSTLLLNGIALCALLRQNLELKGTVSRLVSKQKFYNSTLKQSHLWADECGFPY